MSASRYCATPAQTNSLCWRFGSHQHPRLETLHPSVHFSHLHRVLLHCTFDVPFRHPLLNFSKAASFETAFFSYVWASLVSRRPPAFRTCWRPDSEGDSIPLA
jgi:hypothetical protein